MIIEYYYRTWRSVMHVIVPLVAKPYEEECVCGGGGSVGVGGGGDAFHASLHPAHLCQLISTSRKLSLPQLSSEPSPHSI